MYILHNERGRKRLACQQNFRCRPEVERLEDRRVLAWSAIEVPVPDDAVEPAVPDVVVSPAHAVATSPCSRDQLIDGCDLRASGTYPNLAGMHLIDPSQGQFEGQVVYLDFDGARDVTYNGPVAIAGIDVPSFRLPGDLAGLEGIVIDGLVQRMEETFDNTGVTFTTQLPAGGEYSTVYIGGDGSAFHDHGNFLGLAEQIDVGNTDLTDSALVFSERMIGSASGVALSEVMVHEIGHLLGYGHLGDEAGGASDLASVAHQEATHVFITDQAHSLYQALFGVAGVNLELTVFLDGIDTSSADTGNSIIEGVKEEDLPLTGFRFMNHFSAGGDTGSSGYDELLDGLYAYDSAYTTAASDRYPAAISDYNAGNTATAYWWFGRAMHLLQDSTVPAHVHNDPHAGDPVTGDDQYEVSVTPGVHSDYHNYFRFDTDNGTSWNFQDWMNSYWSTPSSNTILGSSSEALWARSSYYASLEELFRETTDYTDDYDSDDYDGDCHNGISGDHFSLNRLVGLDRSEDTTVHNNWAEQVERDLTRDLEPWEISVLARDVGTWAVEQSTLFMRYFYDELGKVLPVPDNMNVNHTGGTSLELGWDSVAGADGYVVYRSTSPNSDFSRIGISLVPSYSDSGLDPASIYYYRVYSYNSVAGLGSQYGSVASQPVPDINGDGNVDCADVNLLSMEIATGGDNLALYDFDDNGQIELSDLHEWLTLAGEINLGPGFAYVPGDSDLSGEVDGSDFNTWNTYKFTGLGSGGGGGMWCLGDFDANGAVDGSDFNIWNTQKFTSSMQATLDFDLQPLGTFTHLEEDDFTLDWIGIGDLQEVLDLGNGDLVLVDSNPQNVYGAEIVIQRADARTFVLDSLYAADLFNDPSTSYGRIDVEGLSGGSWVMTEIYPTSSTFTKYAPAALVGQELDVLSINLVGSPVDHFSVDDITLVVTPLAGNRNLPLTQARYEVSPEGENGAVALRGAILTPSTRDALMLEVNRTELPSLAATERLHAEDRLFARPAAAAFSKPRLTWRSSQGGSGLDDREYTRHERTQVRSDPNGDEIDFMTNLDAAFALWSV